MERMIVIWCFVAVMCAMSLAADRSPAPAGPQVKLAVDAFPGFLSSDTVQVKVAVDGVQGEGPYAMRFALVDWLGETVWSSEVDGRPATIDVPVARYGSYWLKSSIARKGEQGDLATGQLRLTRPVPVPKLTPEQREQSSIGVNTHRQANWQALAAMGIHVARDYSWYELGTGERAPMSRDGSINFTKVVEDAEAAGVTILPCMQHIFLTGDPKHYIDDAEKVRSSYKRYSEAFPQIKYWELDNESDLRFHGSLSGYDSFMEGYVNFISWAYQGVKSAGNNALIVPNGDAGIYPDRLKQLLNSRVKDYFVVSNSHFYTGTVPPELSRSDFNTGSRDLAESRTFLDQLRKIARLSHENGKGAWLTEVGWDAIGGPAVGEPKQAMYLARMYLLARDCGIDKTFWFFDREAGELNGGIFSSCGLLDRNNAMRPAGAALAAVSKYTAQAEYAGTIDLGEDRWCLLFKPAAGPWVAAAWSVERDHAIPEALANAPAADVFGNDIKPTNLTPAVTYFLLNELPAGWDGQRQAKWISPKIVSGYAGGVIEAKAHVPAGAKVAWKSLPKGVTGSAWQVRDGEATSALSVEEGMEDSEQSLVAEASGEGWQRTWPVTLKIADAVLALPEPYRPGAESKVWVQSNIDDLPPTTFSSPGGRVSPASMKVGLELAQVAFSAAADAKGPQELVMKVGEAKPETHWICPEIIEVLPAADIQIDGRLTEWPKQSALTANWFSRKLTSFEPTAHLGWSKEGLYVAVRMPAKKARGGKPATFWEAPNIELFLDSTGESRQGWLAGTHQFWVIPVEADGKLVAASGEFKRSPSIAASIPDDQRVRKAMSVDGDVLTFEAFFPAEALGSAPSAGQAWRAALVITDGDLNAAWPRAKREGLLEGAQKWGELRFIAQ